MCCNLNNVNMFPLALMNILFLTYFTQKNVLMHFLAAGEVALSYACEGVNNLAGCFVDEYLKIIGKSLRED